MQSISVSIVVPVYNTERYLARCLESLVGQTLKDIEVIVVNDGSTDASQHIINDYAYRFPAVIRAFSKQNGGLSDARNFGLAHCRGRYIGFVDSDDYVSADMFADMYTAAKRHDAEICICNLQKVDERGTVTQKITQLPGFPERIVLKNNLSVFSDISYFACNKIFKLELFAGCSFKKGIHFEDIQLIPQLLLKSPVLAFTPKYHYHYFERSGSITKTHTLRGLDILHAVEDVESAYLHSPYHSRKEFLRNFQILEGIYTFLAYLAFVQDAADAKMMRERLRNFMDARNIGWKNVLCYRRFGRNYLLSLPLSKKIYYLLYISGQYSLIKKFTARD